MGEPGTPAYRQHAAEVVRSSKGKETTLYHVYVARHSTNSTWELAKRYSEFDALQEALKSSGVEIPHFPRKHLVRSNSERVVEERKRELTEFLQGIVVPHEEMEVVRAFLELDRHGEEPPASPEASPTQAIEDMEGLQAEPQPEPEADGTFWVDYQEFCASQAKYVRPGNNAMLAQIEHDVPRLAHEVQVENLRGDRETGNAATLVPDSALSPSEMAVVLTEFLLLRVDLVVARVSSPPHLVDSVVEAAGPKCVTLAVLGLLTQVPALLAVNAVFGFLGAKLPQSLLALPTTCPQASQLYAWLVRHRGRQFASAHLGGPPDDPAALSRFQEKLEAIALSQIRNMTQGALKSFPRDWSEVTTATEQCRADPVVCAELLKELEASTPGSGVARSRAGMVRVGMAEWLEASRQDVVETGLWDVRVRILDDRVVVRHTRTEQDVQCDRNSERRFRVNWSVEFSWLLSPSSKLVSATGTVHGIEFSEGAPAELRAQMLDLLWDRFRAVEREPRFYSCQDRD
eukprot:TRINITY_DN5915_c0_g1_i1.p1 TRINITY_DN5915_c0_g1~~TRINITY_DN5915_c0_g1_i1.p1  ORF type:complete len:516 (+),score=124.61 TRINITY_DN5915_c0_g1_i1:222-1769(+)